MLRTAVFALLWLALQATAPACAQPQLLSETELRETVAGLFDTIVIMPIISVETTQVSNATTQGDGTAVTLSESNISIVNSIDLQSLDVLAQSAPTFVLGGTGTATTRSGVAVPVWVPWSRELMPLLTGQPCLGRC